MRFLLTALGSYGDVLPIVGLAAALEGRGHEAIVITNPHFQPVVEQAGVGYLPLGTEQEYDELARHPDLWRPFWGPVLMMRIGLRDLARKVYVVLDNNFRSGDVLVAHPLDLASRVHQDKFGTTVASAHLSPLMLRSFHQSPQYDGLMMQDWVPRWVKRAQFWLADHIVDRIVTPELNLLRRELGLKPVKGVLGDWFFSPQLVLGLFPQWFAPPQPDWPPNTVLTGFPLWDQSATLEPNQEIEEFLQAGDPPIVFAPGSAMTQGEWFFEAAIDACQRLGRRGILTTRYPEQLPKELPAGVRQFDFIPFSQLLPRAAALVHHGGIGTCGQGLAAGIPQLVMPMAFDQLDNATRLKRLGVAAIIPRKKFRGPAVAQAMEGLLGSEQVRNAAARWARECDSVTALAASCSALERLAQ